MPYVLTVTIPTFDSYIRSRTYVRRRREDTEDAEEDARRIRCGGAAAGGDGGCEDMSQLRESEFASSALLDTSTDAVGKRVYRSVSYHLLSLSLSFPLPSPRFTVLSLLTFVMFAVRDAPTPTLRVFPISVLSQYAVSRFNRKIERKVFCISSK